LNLGFAKHGEHVKMKVSLSRTLKVENNKDCLQAFLLSQQDNGVMRSF
jgi:hypothetical protein